MKGHNMKLTAWPNFALVLKSLEKPFTSDWETVSSGII